MAALAAGARKGRDAPGACAVRIRQYAQPRLLSNYGHHFAAVRDGGWCLGRNRRRWQRRNRWHFAVHGRRIHAEPCCGAKRRLRLSDAGPGDEERVRQEWSSSTSSVALYASADHADGANRRLQSTSLARSAVMPLAAAEPGSIVRRRAC